MGRPIRNDAFGDTAAPGLQFAITAKLPGEAVGEGYIVEQQGTSKYRVDVNGTEGVVYLKNTVTPANLNDGEAYIAVTPFGGSTVAASKIMQKRVYVWDTLDTNLTTRSSYVWSQNPAAQIGQADVGVSTVVSGNALGAADIFVFEQEDPQNAPTKYIDTFIGFGYTSSTSPGGGQHKTFATSDNKIVMFHEGDFTNGAVDGGTVTVLDGTASPVPAVIGGSLIVSTWELLEIDENKPMIIQLTDTRYARIANFDTATLLSKQRIEIIDVNLTTGAAAIDITHDLEQYYDVNRAGLSSNNIFITKISSTRFAVVFNDVGISTATPYGALYAMVFDDAGTSINVQMAKTAMVDMTAPANNLGDVTADVSRISGNYLGNTNRTLTGVFETTRNAVNDVICVACEFNATFTGFDTTGAPHVWLDGATYVGGFSPRIEPVNDTYFIVADEDRRAGADAPLLLSIGEVNPSTFAITTGTPTRMSLVQPGNSDAEVRIDNDFSIYVDSTTKAYVHTNYEENEEVVNTGTRTINLAAFDGTQDMSGDYLVDTAANLTTAWAGTFTGTRVLAVDTGLLYNYNGTSWDLMTVNASRWDYRGQAMMELTFDLPTRTISVTKQEMLTQEQLPRFESDGAGGAQYTYLNTGFEVDSANIVKLPNGKYVISCESIQRIKIDAPFYTKAAADAAATNGHIGGDLAVQYFDPNVMP